MRHAVCDCDRDRLLNYIDWYKQIDINVEVKVEVKLDLKLHSNTNNTTTSSALYTNHNIHANPTDHHRIPTARLLRYDHSFRGPSMLDSRMSRDV